MKDEQELLIEAKEIVFDTLADMVKKGLIVVRVDSSTGKVLYKTTELGRRTLEDVEGGES